MKIFLIRHGESTQNVFTNFENYPDFNVPLTDKGKDDAKKCGEFLIEYCKENKIDLKNVKILVSPFERTRQPAKIINTYLNIQAIKEETLLIERQFGLFDNKTFEEREKYKDAFEFQNWMYEHGGNFYTKFPLGESNFELSAVKSGSDYIITAPSGFDIYLWSVDDINGLSFFYYVDELNQAYNTGNIAPVITQNTLTFNEQNLPAVVTADGTYRVFCQALKINYDSNGDPESLERAGLDFVVIKM